MVGNLRRLILSVLGILIFSALASVSIVVVVSRALPPPIDHDVSVNGEVLGAPPTVGAVILFPKDGSIITYRPLTEIKGTCEPNTFVVIYSNNSAIGSTNCTGGGTFALFIQLQIGKNVLYARNYDGSNQPGPSTPSITVTVVVPDGEEYIPYIPAPPQIPDIFRSCLGYTPPVVSIGGKPRVVVVCAPLSVDPNRHYNLGILVYGGTPPYALDIDWGDGQIKNTLLSIPKEGYKEISFVYPSPGVYKITFKLKDNADAAGYTQAVMRVNGAEPESSNAVRDALGYIAWFNSPVPLYIALGVVTFGFWIGYIFHKRFHHHDKVKK